MVTPKWSKETWSRLIANPKLPESFEITDEMKQDPVINFFLTHYQWAREASIKEEDWKTNFVDADWSFISDSGNRTDEMNSDDVLSWELSSFDINFSEFWLDNDISMLFNWKKFRYLSQEQNVIKVLSFFLPEAKRNEFHTLFRGMNIIRPEVDYALRWVGRILWHMGLDSSYFTWERYTPEIWDYVESQLWVVADDIKQILEDISKRREANK